MLRYLIIAIALLVVSPVWSQDRIFRASQIDLQQNKRLDTLESRVAKLESPIEETVTVESEIQTPIVGLATDPLTGTSVNGPAVLMITNGACRWCDRWWAASSQSLKDQGWQVEKVVGSFPGVDLYPTFRIYDRKTWSRHSGYMSMDDLRGLLGRSTLEGKAQSQEFVRGRYSTDELRQLIQIKRPSGWRGPVYADVSPRASAKQHLVGSEHGFSWEQVSGLSQNEALILHDLAPSHGNQIFPYRSGSQPAKTVMANGCPNGGCPNQSRLTSRWFRR